MMRMLRKMRQSVAKRVYRNDAVARVTANQYHRSFYYRKDHTWENTSFLGVPLWKCPLDLWIYQELLFDLRPDVVVECGTNRGGSAFYMGHLMDLIGHGRIVTVDIEDLKGDLPTHDRVEYLIGSSTSDPIVARVQEVVEGAGTVLAILDSDHSRDHVLRELELYTPLVTPGSYCIVEDTNLHGHPITPGDDPGPMEALDLFLARTDAFEVDAARTKYGMTFNPRGYLKRIR